MPRRRGRRVGYCDLPVVVPLMQCHPHSYGLGLSASFASAAAAAVGSFPLLAMLVDVADEHPAIYAGVRAQALESRVVGLYGVVVILGGWMRVGCARLFGVHSF